VSTGYILDCRKITGRQDSLAIQLSDHFSLHAEPAINFLKCGIDFARQENNLDNNGDGDIKTETTESDIDVTYLNLPFLLHYQFASRFYLLAGWDLILPDRRKSHRRPRRKKMITTMGY